MTEHPTLEQLEKSAKVLHSLIVKIKNTEAPGVADKDLLLQESRNLYGQLLLWEPGIKVKESQLISEPEEILDELIPEEEPFEEEMPAFDQPEIIKEETISEPEEHQNTETTGEIETAEEEYKNPEVDYIEEEEDLADDFSFVVEDDLEQETKEEDVFEDSETEPETETEEETTGQSVASEIKTTLDLFSDTTEDSLGTTFARQKQPSLGEVMKKPVGDLREAIGINDKFLFINEMFNGDMSRYNKVLDELNDFTGLSGAITYLSELSVQYNWKKDQAAYRRFEELLQKKYN
ncbi:MAG: hypothetical protein JXR65_04900 [Bacteroidales bacterium]|nr:hypothetical protein [Bacteroidales bacterium]